MQATQANRGRGLEDLIETANAQYLARGIAKIRKLPTPYQIVRRGNQMQAIPAKRSGLDYVGVCQGRAIMFDCKQTREVSFPLKNIPEHQLGEAAEWQGNGGIAFWVIEFCRAGMIYRVPHDGLETMIDTAFYAERKSIPRDWLPNEWVVRSADGLVLDYLAGLWSDPLSVIEEALGYGQ